MLSLPEDYVSQQRGIIPLGVVPQRQTARQVPAGSSRGREEGGTAMENRNNALSIVLLVALAVYFVSPVDAVPGPIDDAILILAYILLNRRGIEA